MAVGLSYVQRNNAERDRMRKETAHRVERIIEEADGVSSLWEAVKREGLEDLLDNVLEQGDIDIVVRDALARGGWQETMRVLRFVPEGYQDGILRLGHAGELVPFGTSDLEDDLRDAVDLL